VPLGRTTRRRAPPKLPHASHAAPARIRYNIYMYVCIYMYTYINFQPCATGTYNPSTGATKASACAPCRAGTYSVYIYLSIRMYVCICIHIYKLPAVCHWNVQPVDRRHQSFRIHPMPRRHLFGTYMYIY